MFFFLIFFIQNCFSAETEYRLAPIEFNGSASFERLRDDTYVPAQTLPISTDRGSTLDALKWQSNFPLNSQGYPSGSLGIGTGGRSNTDTQVSTLGVPLNLAQGGGADFSFFPSFLWKEAKVSRTTSSAGFSPEAASGSVELVPWSREIVKSEKISPPSRLTASYDRDIQTFSIGSKKDNIAILGGMSSGRLRGPSGELSYYFYRKPKQHFLFHLLGSDQEGDSPGPKTNPSPQAKKKAWRVIPVIESHQDFDDFILESTFYGDFHGLKFTDPSANGINSSTKTAQLGVENALVFGSETIALSARRIQFNDASSTQSEYVEWPVFGVFTHDFFSESGSFALKASLNANYLNSIGTYPGGKLSSKFLQEQNRFFFLEINSITKMPTLLQRRAVYLSSYGNYYGNPQLKPERVHQLLGGYSLGKDKIKSETTIKLEYRNDIQVSNASYTSTLNSGNATLAYLEEDLKINFSNVFKVGSQTTFTTSKLNNNQLPYPDLPSIMQGFRLEVSPDEQWSILTHAKLMGDSITSGGKHHSAYSLYSESVSYQASKNISFGAGVDNVFDDRAEVIVNYPLPGRMFYLSMQANF